MIVCHHIYLQMGWSLSAGHWGIQLGELWPLDLEKMLRIEWDMVKIVKISISPISQSILNHFPSSLESFWRQFTGEYSLTQETSWNQLQTVFFSVEIGCDHDCDQLQPSATATEGLVFSSPVRSSCGLFPVLVTRPRNTNESGLH